MKQPELQLTLRDEIATLAFGEGLAKCCQYFLDQQIIVHLCGQLGAGKTTLARGFMRGLGYSYHVKSPSYTLVEPYEFNGFFVYHFDFYRIQGPEELEFIGVEDFFANRAICLIEWPDLGKGFLPDADVSCFMHIGEEGRVMKVIAHSAQGAPIVKCCQHEK